MPRVSIVKYMGALFEPIVAAAGLPDLLGKLKTAPLPPDRTESQYALLRDLLSYGGDYVSLPGSSFLCQFRDSKCTYACLQIDGIAERHRDRLKAQAESIGMIETKLTEAMFLFLVYNMRGAFRVKSEYITKEGAENVINIIDESYIGHSIYDAMNWFYDTLIFEIKSDSLYYDRNNFAIAAFFASVIPELRSGKIDDELAAKIQELSKLPSINPESLYFVLTSSHWRHIALELYKCIEALFYLPWVRALRDRISFAMDGLSLAQYCRAELGWQERGDESIEKIFEGLPKEIVDKECIERLKCFENLDLNMAKSSAIGRRIYKIRNQLVHYEDRRRKEPVPVPEQEWREVCAYLCNVIAYLYTRFDSDIGFKFPG